MTDHAYVASDRHGGRCLRCGRWRAVHELTRPPASTTTADD